MATHTPGRIRLKRGDFTRLETCDGEGTVIASTWTSSFAPPRDEAQENARRIELLWNLAGDVPTDDIVGFWKFLEAKKEPSQ